MSCVIASATRCTAPVDCGLDGLNGLRFHFREWPCPKADAQDLVLHGFTGHARSWDTFAQAMSADYRVLALDQRGHGESEWAAPDQYGTPYMVADLEAFVAALGLNRLVLLGLSMSGSVAIHYAGKQPAALERLVIVDIGPEIGTRGLIWLNPRVQAKDVFSSPEEVFKWARAANSLPPEGFLQALHAPSAPRQPRGHLR